MDIRDIEDRINDLNTELYRNRYRNESGVLSNISSPINMYNTQICNDIMDEIKYLTRLRDQYYYSQQFNNQFLYGKGNTTKCDIVCEEVTTAIEEFYKKNPNCNKDIIIRNIDGKYHVAIDNKRDLKLKIILEDE